MKDNPALDVEYTTLRKRFEKSDRFHAEVDSTGRGGSLAIAVYLKSRGGHKRLIDFVTKIGGDSQEVYVDLTEAEQRAIGDYVLAQIDGLHFIVSKAYHYKNKSYYLYFARPDWKYWDAQPKAEASRSIAR